MTIEALDKLFNFFLLGAVICTFGWGIVGLVQSHQKYRVKSPTIIEDITTSPFNTEYVGFSTPQNDDMTYHVVLGTCSVRIRISKPGISNSTKTSFKLPFKSAQDFVDVCTVINNGVRGYGLIRIKEGSNIAIVEKDVTGGQWTASGVKGFQTSDLRDIYYKILN